MIDMQGMCDSMCRAQHYCILLPYHGQGKFEEVVLTTHWELNEMATIFINVWDLHQSSGPRLTTFESDLELFLWIPFYFIFVIYEI